MKFLFQPVVDDNNHIVLYIFSSNNENPEFITDQNVELCGSLRYWMANWCKNISIFFLFKSSYIKKST